MRELFVTAVFLSVGFLEATHHSLEISIPETTEQISQDSQIVNEGDQSANTYRLIARDHHTNDGIAIRLRNLPKCFLAYTDENKSVQVRDMDVKIEGVNGINCCFEPSALALRNPDLVGPTGELIRLQSINIAPTSDPQYFNITDSSPNRFKIHYDKIYCSNVYSQSLSANSKQPQYRSPTYNDLQRAFSEILIDNPL